MLPIVAHPEPVKTHDRAFYMSVAIWMLEFRSRYSDNHFEAILAQLRMSHKKAGGPALRLARAVWFFDHRTRLPDSPDLRVLEENAFAHLVHKHRDVKKAHRTRVWHAIELFIPLREAHFGSALMPVTEEPPMGTPDPVVKAIRLLDQAVNPYNWLVRRSNDRLPPFMASILEGLGSADPTDAHLIVPLAEAAYKYGRWRENMTLDNFTEFQKAANTALNVQYLNGPYLRNLFPKLDNAFHDIRKVLSRAPVLPPLV